MSITHRGGGCFMICIALIGVFGLFFITLDTNTRRRNVSRQIDDILEDSRRDPENPAHVKKLLAIAQGRYPFGATMATHAIGKSGESAKFVVEDLARLLRSSDHTVSREAAISLLTLNAKSESILNELELAIKNDEGTDTLTFSIEAIGEMGPFAKRSIPLLESKLGMHPRIDREIREAIDKIKAGSIEKEKGAE